MGVALQVSYWPAQREAQLKSAPLDVGKQPTPLHVPMGVNARGQDDWKSIVEMDSVLIGGARRMGKTWLLHGWIQALIHGGQVELLLYDGKGGVEFLRYAGSHVTVAADNLPSALATVQMEVARREQLFRQKSVTSLSAYNALPGIAPLRPLVLILDELADLPEEAEAALIELVRRAGAYGVHPIVGIQRPDAGVMKGQLRANLTTRIALPVASLEDSRIILGRTGAEKLPKVKGRLLMVWDARLTEIQAYQVTLPEVGSHALPPRPSLFSERELALVRAAIDLDGWFRVREIAERVGESRDWVNGIAQRWEIAGYLTVVQRNPQGHTLGRRVTEMLRLAAGFGGQADAADRADKADSGMVVVDVAE